MSEEREAELRRELAKVLLEKGLRLFKQGNLTEALEAFEEAESLYRKLIELAPDSQELKEHLARVLIGKGGILFRLGSHEQSIKTYEEAESIIRELLSLEERDELLSRLALIQLKKAMPLRELGRFEDAFKAYREARSLLERLHEAGHDVKDKLIFTLVSEIATGLLCGREKQELLPLWRKAEELLLGG